MSFCTVIDCMDGRVQRSVLDFMTERFGVPYVDTITAPGPNGILSRQDDERALHSILRCIEVSVHKHRTVGIAVVGHHDCAGNPGDREHQDTDTRAAVCYLRDQFPHTRIIGLWVDETQSVEEIDIPSMTATG
jgi:carbonic anhydrase